MKKLLFIFLMFMGGLAHAIDFSVTREESGFVKHSFNGLTVSTSIILIDLSDTSNFPHVQTGYANLTNLRVSIDKVAASSVAVSVGVVYEVNASSGNVEWIYSNVAVADIVQTHIDDSVNFAPGVVRLYVNSSGVTPYIAVSSTTVQNTTYQTDVGLPTTNAKNGAVFPAVGDVILRIDNDVAATASNITVEGLYYTKRP